jgi:hypothetical protein
MPPKKTVPDLTQISYTQYQAQHPDNPISRATYQRYKAEQSQQLITQAIDTQASDKRSITNPVNNINNVTDEDKAVIVSRSIECLKQAVLNQPLSAQWALERLAHQDFAKREPVTTNHLNNIGIKLVFGGKKRNSEDVNVSIN